MATKNPKISRDDDPKLPWYIYVPGATFRFRTRKLAQQWRQWYTHGRAFGYITESGKLSRRPAE